METTTGHVQAGHDACKPGEEGAGFGPRVIDPEYVTENAVQLVSSLGGNGHAGSHAEIDLRSSLLHALNTIQPHPYTWRPGADRPSLQFSREDGLDERTLAKAMNLEELPAGWCYSPEDRVVYSARTGAGLELLRRVSPRAYQSFNLLVGALIYGRRPHHGGGSNSAVIGCVWLSCSPSWTETDFAATLLHEYVHQALFLDDMLHDMFSVDADVLATDEALVTSALLKTRRPYDRAFHSCFVSFALMQFYDRLRQHECIAPHVAPFDTTLSELEQHDRWLTPHGRSVLAELRFASSQFFAARPAIRVGASC